MISHSLPQGTDPLFWGRIWGPFALEAIDFLKGDGDEHLYHFSQEKIKQFKEHLSTTNRTLESAGQFDDGNGAGKVEVVELKKEGKLIQRYGIDPSRGYICPLIEIYDEKTGRLLSEYRSSDYFIHQKTGLYFPGVFVETVNDPKTGAIVTKKRICRR
jgi:hypothetical protein